MSAFANEIDCTFFLACIFNCVNYPSTSLDTPLGFQEFEASTISRQRPHEVGKVVSCTQRPPLSPDDTPSTHFCYNLSQSECHSATGRIMSMTNLMTPSGKEPTNFRPVAQCLSHLLQYVLPLNYVSSRNI